MDFMSYSALNLVQNDPDALLNPDTLANVSSHVFSSFFKHFALAGMGEYRDGLYMNGSWAVQPLHSVIPSDLGPINNFFSDDEPRYLQDTFAPSNYSAVVNGIVDVPIEKLELSPVAVILSLVILSVLALTTLVMLGWRRHYLGMLPRDVDTIASVLGFLYASERMLAVARQIDRMDNGHELATIGQFESDGKHGWGVEIVDEIEGESISR